jgi:hypothetical protein
MSMLRFKGGIIIPGLPGEVIQIPTTLALYKGKTTTHAHAHAHAQTPSSPIFTLPPFAKPPPFYFSLLIK